MEKFFRSGYIWAMQLPAQLPKTVRATVKAVPVNERKRGSKYFPEIGSEIVELRQAGWTDIEIADHLGVNKTTLYDWMARHQEFAEAMKSDKQAIERVKATLYNTAIGYSYVEQQAIKVKTGEHTEEVEVVDVVKHVPPVPSSIIFFLKNKDRANWTDTQRVETDVNVNVNMSTDFRELALAMIATIQAGMAAPMIEGEAKRTEEGNE